MQIKVSGKQIDVGDALSTHVENRLTSAISKYFDRPAEGSVVFSRDAHNFRCDSSVHLPTGLTAQAQARAADIYAAFEQAADRLEKQVRRYKRKIRDHHQTRQKPIEMVAAQSYVLARQEEEAEADDADEPGDQPAGDLQPAIIAESITDIQALTVGEAVMQMELADAQFLVFQNVASGRLNVVFQREDGNIGWIDPNGTGA